MKRIETSTTIPERPINQAETERIATERREAMRNSIEKAERAQDASVRDKEEQLSTLHDEAITATQKDPTIHETPPAKRRSHILSKHDREISFKKHMNILQSELPTTQRRFSKLIHQPAVESVSDAVGATIARPNALLIASISAFIFTTATYIFAKYVGLRLSGFEMIGAFAIGWIVGMIYDYLRLMATGGTRR